MGKIFYIMGKSATGKDTIYKLLQNKIPKIKNVVLYTTRPIRSGEMDGVEYYFTTEDQIKVFRDKKQLIEVRTYNTIHGLWSYFTVDDGQIDLVHNSYLMIGTLESYSNILNYYGKDSVVPIYIHVEDGIRLQRALDREKIQKDSKYKEVCRRFLADDEDFNEESRKKLHINKIYNNTDLLNCVEEINMDITGII